MDLIIRRMQPADAAAAAPLVYSSGPAAFSYVFSHRTRTPAVEFLTGALANPGGEFGYAVHWVGVLGGEVVASGASFSGRDLAAFTVSAAVRIIRCYGPLTGLRVMGRGLQVESVVPPPKSPSMHYIAHIGVRPDLRSRGIGARLVTHLIELGRQQGRTVAALDVSVENPRAQALYERLGFVVTAEHPSKYRNETAAVPSHRRMELPLTPGA